MDVIYNFLLENFTLLFSLIILAIVLGISFLGSISIATWLRSSIAKVFKKKFSGKFKTHMIDDAAIKKINKINTNLAVLRAELDADRSYIFQFHNGDTFLSRDPRWKASQTYEKVKSGISYEGKNLQNLEVSLHWSDFLSIFFTTDEKNYPKGFNTLRRNPICNDSCNFPRRVYSLNVADMDRNDGPSKTIMESQHIYYALFAPIVDADNNILGFIGVDYCSRYDDEFLFGENVKPCLLCQFAGELQLLFERDPKLKKAILRDNHHILGKSNIFA